MLEAWRVTRRSGPLLEVGSGPSGIPGSVAPVQGRRPGFRAPV